MNRKAETLEHRARQHLGWTDADVESWRQDLHDGPAWAQAAINELLAAAGMEKASNLAETSDD